MLAIPTLPLCFSPVSAKIPHEDADIGGTVSLSTVEASMLLAFRVSNFKSIRDEAELLLVRSRRLAAGETLGEPVAGDFHPNPVTALYGANASGKSNVLAALAFLSAAVADSFTDWEPGGGVPVTPFLLDESSAERASRFEVDVALDDVRYHYGFVADRERIREEWLYAYPNRRRQVWFERTADDPEPFYFGAHLKGPNRGAAGLTRGNALFLSTAASVGHKQLTVIAHWLANGIKFVHRENERDRMGYTSRAIREEEAVKNRILLLLRAADLGIEDIVVQSERLPPEQRERFLRALRELHPDDSELDEEQVGATLEYEFINLQLQHSAGGDKPVGLPFHAESQGTRALIALAGPALDALRHGEVLLIDEIESNLHPDLFGEIVRFFQDASVNTNGAQLIFATHETTLLDTVTGEAAILGRDQAWRTSKDHSGRTSLTPFSDFRLRKGDNLRRHYLQGRLGGVPVLDFSELHDTERGRGGTTGETGAEWTEAEALESPTRQEVPHRR